MKTFNILYTKQRYRPVTLFPFGFVLIYTVKNVVTESDHIVYNDGVIKLFLYTKETKGGSKELKDLLTYMEHTTVESAVDRDLQEIQSIVNNVKERRETKERFMTLQEMINYEKRDSYNAGISHGIQGIINLCKSHSLGIISAKETIMKEYSLTEDEADEYINLYW